jgi:ribosomal protein L21
MNNSDQCSSRDAQLQQVRIAYGNATVVRDDLLEGGSKTRFLDRLVQGAQEVVFGGPFCGGAPFALSVLGRKMGFKVTLFYAKRKQLHQRQLAALANGAQIYQVPFGYMTNVQAKARAYAEANGALFLPFGFDVPEASTPFIEQMQAVGRQVGPVDEIWCATGSGMLARCLGRAFPSTPINGVAVGLKSRWEKQTMPPNVRIHAAGVPFAKTINDPCPFPCCANYDRKAWRFCVRYGRGRVLFWNVLG